VAPKDDIFFLPSSASFYDVVDVLTEEHGSFTLHRMFSWMRKFLNYSQAETGGPEGTVIVDASKSVTGFVRSKKDADDALSRRLRQPVESLLWQISFFRVRVENPSQIGDPNNEDLLGTIWWRQFPDVGMRLPAHEHVFEAVLRIPPIPDYYHHVHRNFSGVRVCGREFEIEGVYFTQQDGMTTVCAHSALTIAVNNAPLIPDKFITPEEMNKSLGFDHASAETRFGWYPFDDYDDAQRELASGYAGIDKKKTVKILEGFGLSCLSRDYRAWRNCDFENLAYPVVESGFPVLMSFGTDSGLSNHVICLLGHTYNSDSWLSQARQGYQYTIKGLARHQAWLWIPHFLCSDDNLGAYYCMERSALKKPLLYDIAPDLRVNDVIAILPSPITRDPGDAEEDATYWLHGLLDRLGEPPDEAGYKWMRRLFAAVASPPDPPVTRTLLAQKDRYRAHLLEHAPAGSDTVIDEVVKDLPEVFWITEFSLVDLYSANRAKLGEVLQRPDGKCMEDCFIVGRLPACLFPTIDGDPRSFPINGYIPIYQSVASQSPEVVNW